ncbi:PRC-barrel domain-containing protein [Xanthobacter sp. V3C-3]|uniref:PRC-barrel domain-containing protein n=1 Tax=Xanthobacter lutulentifluminis TaxID=3119935 RepID=UPI00372A6313
MRKMPIYAVAAAALLSTAAIAQQTTPTTPGTTVPPAAQMTPPAARASTAFIAQQSADQMLASDLIGMTVRGGGDENLGEINDLVVDRSGTVMGALIGVGGFLGMGEKDVAVPFQAVEITRGTDGKERLVLRKTKDELKAAPAFTKYERPAPAATGSVNPNRPAATPPVGTTPQATTPPASR